MTSTIGGAGTSFEESAATMTVPGREMRDGEGTIGMTGEAALTYPAPQTQPFRSEVLFRPTLRLHCPFPYKMLLGCNPSLDRFSFFFSVIQSIHRCLRF